MALLSLSKRVCALVLTAMSVLPAWAERTCAADSAVVDTVEVCAVEESVDSVKRYAYDTPEWRRKNWVSQLFANGFRINDPGINYPKFARFCLKVYNWGDKTFNSYDPCYVVGSGKNWKFYGKSYAWACPTT